MPPNTENAHVDAVAQDDPPVFAEEPVALIVDFAKRVNSIGRGNWSKSAAAHPTRKGQVDCRRGEASGCSSSNSLIASIVFNKHLFRTVKRWYC